MAPTQVSVSGDTATVVAPAGTLIGSAQSALLSFKGIPYAQPPVGELRWKPPVPAGASSGSVNAKAYAKHCPQEDNKTDPAASEDCLYLNVFAPAGVATSLTKRPVMVWIYGGANAFGASDFYDPSALVESGDVLVVTLNYRVGALGFLAHPDLRSAGGPAVNYGVMDQQLALKWIRDNIAAFGGDPHNVTLFGESAGGLNITTHLVSEGSAGLFHKAIIQSGGYLLETPSLQEADAKGEAFAAKLGCSAAVAACLRGKTVAEILAAQGTVNTASAAYHQMVVDGTVLKEQQAVALAAGRFHRVPVVVGSNANEGNLWYRSATTQAAYETVVNDFSVKNHRAPADTFAKYPASAYPNVGAAASAVLGDAEFSCPARRTARWLSAHVPVFAYEFADPASLFNSAHFADVYYLFAFKGQQGMGISGPADSQALSLAMRRYWSNFARAATPNGGGVPQWSSYDTTKSTLQLLTPPSPAPDTADPGSDFPSRHKCDYWG